MQWMRAGAVVAPLYITLGSGELSSHVQNDPASATWLFRQARLNRFPLYTADYMPIKKTPEK